MDRIATLMDRVLESPEDAQVAANVQKEVRALANEFPLYS